MGLRPSCEARLPGERREACGRRAVDPRTARAAGSRGPRAGLAERGEPLELTAHSTISGDRLASLQLRTTDPVATLRAKVAESACSGFASAFALALIHDGALLRDADTLERSGLQDGSRVEVVLARSTQTIAFSDRRVRVLQGSRISSIWVGGESGYNAFGQLPPAQGDAWELEFDAAPGPYELVFRGGRNAHHGIVTVTIDGEVVGKVDQYSRQTEYPVEDALPWVGRKESGRSVLRCSSDSKRPEAHGYWICLLDIELRPSAS